MKPIITWIVLAVPLTVALCLLWAHIYTYAEAEDRGLWWAMLALGTLVCCLVCTGLAAGVESVITDHANQVWQECWRAPLTSIRSSDGVGGSISSGLFVISGYAGPAQVFYYYTKEGDGAYKPHSWKADGNTTIFEEEREDGEIVQYDRQFKHSWVGWFASPGTQIRTDFHIPKGSLKSEFKVQ